MHFVNFIEPSQNGNGLVPVMSVDQGVSKWGWIDVDVTFVPKTIKTALYFESDQSWWFISRGSTQHVWSIIQTVGIFVFCLFCYD